MVFRTFVGVNVLAQSAPESRNLHLKFQIFWGMTPLDWTPTADSTDPFMLTPSMADGKGASTNCDAVGCHVFLTV